MRKIDSCVRVLRVLYSLYTTSRTKAKIKKTSHRMLPYANPLNLKKEPFALYSKMALWGLIMLPVFISGYDWP